MNPPVALTFLATLLVADDWPQFRGPGARGLAADDASYPATIDPAAPRWSTALPPGDSSPCVVGELVVVTAYDDERLETIALDRATGEVRWRRPAQVETLERVYETHGPATPTCTGNGDVVVAYFGSLGLIAYDHAGEELWRRPFELAPNSFGTASSPVLVGEMLLLNRDTNGESFLLALDVATGDTIWRRERPEAKSGWSTPVVRGDELVIYGPGWLAAYSLADGEPRWTLPGLTDEPCTTPVVAGELLYVTSYNMNGNPEVIGIPTFDEVVVKYDADGDGALDRAEVEPNESVLSRFDADGEGDHPLRMFFRFLDVDHDGELRADEWPKLAEWLNQYSHVNALLAVRPGGEGGVAEVAWKFERGVPECPSPVVVDGRVFMVKNGGFVTILDAATGAVHDRVRLDAGGPYYASPVAADGKVYLASARGEVSVVAAGDTCEVLSRVDLGARILATPALADGVVYVRTAERLYAFAR